MMNERFLIKILYTLGIILLLSRLLVLICGIIFFKYLKRNRKFNFLLSYTTISILIALFELSFVWIADNFTNLIMPFLIKFSISNTFFLSPLYYLNEILFIGLSYSYALDKGYKKFIQISVSFLFIAEILNSVFWEGYQDAQTFGSLGNSIFQIILSFLYIKNFYSTKFGSTKDSFLIISWAIFISSTFSIFVYFLTNYLFTNDTILYYQISIFRMIVESLCLLLMAYGVSFIRNSPLTPSSKS